MADGSNSAPTATAKTSGLVARVAQAARFAISGVAPDTWMSPLQPLAPVAPPDVKGRQWDYPVGINVRYIPRSDERVSFARLRALAENCNILRSVIERQKELVESFDWQIKPREDTPGHRPAESKYAAQIAEITAFLQSPDKVNDWQQWLHILLEEVYVVDALAIYRRPTLDRSQLWGLEIIAGDTLTPLIDSSGRRPQPPDPAYQQVIKGVPAGDFSLDELIYYPRSPRANRLYGMPPVQWIIGTVETSIERVKSQLAYFTEGNAVDALLTAPETWTTDQITTWQTYWDDQFVGHVERRRQGQWVPFGVDVKQLKQPPLKDDFDEWLARVICFAYSTSPQPFIKQVSRGNQESQQEVAEEGGIASTMTYVKRLLDKVIRVDLQHPELEFSWSEDREFDPVAASQIDDTRLKNGSRVENEIRDRNGEDPYDGDWADEPFIIVPGEGPVWLAMAYESQKKALEAPTPAPPPAEGGPPAPVGGNEGGGQPRPQNESGPAKTKPAGLEKRARPSVALDSPKMRDARLVVRAKVKDALDRLRTQVEAQVRAGTLGKAAATDAPLYAARKLTLESAVRLAEWAKGQGFVDVTAPTEMHATIAYSREPFGTSGDATPLASVGGPRSVERLGDKGAIVLRFENDRLAKRWSDLRDAGASWDYDGYQPHVTVSWGDAGLDVDSVDPYRGPLVFGPEIHAPLQEINPHGVMAKAADDDDPDADDMADAVDLAALDALPEAIEESLAGVAETGGNGALVQLGVSDYSQLTKQVAQRALIWARERAAELVGKRWTADGELIDNPDARWAISDSTRDMMRRTIADALSANLSVPQLVDKIAADYAFSDARAELIAHTEVARANVQGALEGAREARDSEGVVARKVWLLGQEPCDVCLDNSDEGPIDLDDDFPSGDDGPPAHPNCFCSISWDIGDLEDDT